MALKIFLYICIISICECKINITVKVASSKNGASVHYNGSDDKLITDKEITIFNVSDYNLKNGVNIELGKIPDDVFLYKSPKYGDLHRKYKWKRIKRNLRVEKAEILDVISKDVIVNKIDHINNTTRSTRIKINEFVPLDNIIFSSWSKEGLPDDDFHYNIHIDFILKKVTLENKWREKKLKTVETHFGLMNLGYVNIKPGFTVATKLTAKKTTVLVKIIYKAQLTGSVILNFAHVYGKYHFYAPAIADIMKAGGLSNEILTTQIIEIKCYTDPRMEVFDKKTGKRMPILFVNKPFWIRKSKKKKHK